MKLTLPSLASACLCGLLAFGASARSAEVTFDVHLDTSALVGNLAAPFYLDFQLNDGSGLGNGNNMAFISQFNFHGGNSLADINTFGGASGNLTTGVSLIDNSFINEFFQAFTPGNALDFRIRLTTNIEFPTPDLFAFSILDHDLFSLPTTSPSDAFLLVNLDRAVPTPQSFAGDVADGGIALAAPTVVTVPETASVGLYAALATAAIMAFSQVSRRRALNRG